MANIAVTETSDQVTIEGSLERQDVAELGQVASANLQRFNPDRHFVIELARSRCVLSKPNGLPDDLAGRVRQHLIHNGHEISS